jgi:hypothetical protein
MAVNAPWAVFIRGLKEHQHGFTPRFHPLDSAPPKSALERLQVFKGKKYRLRFLAANSLVNVIHHAPYFRTLGHTRLRY